MGAGVKLDARQLRIVDVLKERSPKLAGAYQMALENLHRTAIDGCASARVSVVCHCMRELMIGLPAVMADDPEPRPDPSSNSLTQQLPELLAKHPDLDLGVNQDIVPVPKAVAQILNSLLGTVVREKGRNQRIAAALITGGHDVKHPVIKQWGDAYNFFVGWTHLDRNQERERELPSDDVLMSNIKIVEDVVEVRTKVFFENVHAIEDLLNEINEQVEDQP